MTNLDLFWSGLARRASEHTWNERRSQFSKVHGIVMYVAGILGIMMLVTAALAYCTLYPALKINTACSCKPK